ncbi:MAG: hypothetical protein ACRC46_13555 [Thermoguttaceae bacterium]
MSISETETSSSEQTASSSLDTEQHRSALGAAGTSSAVRHGCKCDESGRPIGAGVFGGGGDFVERLTSWSEHHAKLLGVGLLVFVVGMTWLLMWHSSLRQRQPVTVDYTELPAEIVFGGKTFPGQYFRGLEATRRAKHADLITEVRDVIAAGEAPAFLLGNTASPKQNLAASLRELFLAYAPHGAAASQSDALYKSLPTGDVWGISPATLVPVESILKELSPAMERLRSELDNTETAFEFVLLEAEDGSVYPDPNIPDLMRLFAAVSEYDIARALNAGQLDDAIKILASTWRIADLASSLENVVTRDEVRAIRLRCLNVLQTIVLHPQFAKQHLESVRAMLYKTLSVAPNEPRLWIGDRATGMRVYEIAIRYGLDEALEADELDAIESSQIGFDRVVINLYKTISADEVTYLRAMRKIIELSAQPYYQRKRDVLEIETKIAALWQANNEAVIAYFLTRHIADTMQALAYEQAAMEATFIAVSLALNQNVNTKLLDPVSGQNYIIKTQDGKVQVSVPEQPYTFRVAKIDGE